MLRPIFSSHDHYIASLGQSGFTLAALPSFERRLSGNQLAEPTLSPDEKLVALVYRIGNIYGGPHYVQMCNTETAQFGFRYDFDSGITGFAFSPDSSRFAVGLITQAMECVEVYDVTTHQRIGSFPGGWIDRPFLDSAHLLVAYEAAEARVPRLYSLAAGKNEAPIDLTDANPRTELFDLRAGMILGLCSGRVWDRNTGKLLRDFKASADRAVFFNEQPFVVVRGADKNDADFFNLNGQFVYSLKAFRWPRELSNGKWSMTLAPHSTRFLTQPAEGSNSSITLWKLRYADVPVNVLKMPEFWMSLFFAGAFAWSLFRFRRTIIHSAPHSR